MIKPTWNITENEVLRILEMHQKATKNLYLNEQTETSAEYSLGTDKNKVGHDFLSRFGLPKSPKGANDYYSTDLKTILTQALNGQQSNFLSIFEPLGEDSGGYHDFLEIGNQSMEVDLKGIPSPAIVVDFGGPNQTVVASHNGLLMMYRAMDEMNKIKAPINASMKFGEAKTTKGKADERETKGTVFSLENATRPYFNSLISDQALAAAVNPEFRSKIVDEKDRSFANFTPEQSKQYWLENTNSIIQGLDIPDGFVSSKHKQQVGSLKGWINTINPEFVNKVIDTYVSLQGEDDWDYDKNKVSQEKAQKILQMVSEPANALVEEMKKVYLKNLQLYLNTFLPRTSNQLMAQVNQKFQPRFNLSYVPTHYTGLFRGTTPGGTIQTKQTDVKQTTTPRKSGY